MKRKLGRREFLRRAVGSAAVAIVGGSVSEAVAGGSKDAPTGALPVRAFGKTGVKLPVFGLGGAELAKAWGAKLSFAGRVKLVRYAYDRGVRYFDTAGNYMESQPIIGEAMQGVRDDVFLNTRVETTRPADVRRLVEKSLKELKTDHVDTIQIHGTPGLEYMSVKQAMLIHGELMKLKDEGIARFVGFSAHSYFDKALGLIKSGGFDMCMLSYGYIGRGHDQLWSNRLTKLRDECVAEAGKRGMALTSMKVMGAWMMGTWAWTLAPKLDRKRLRGLPGAAIRHVMNDDRVSVLCIGAIGKEEIDSNVEIMSGDATYTAEDRELLADFLAAARNSDAMKKLKVDKI